jgi:hypothetical protein
VEAFDGISDLDGGLTKNANGETIQAMRGIVVLVLLAACGDGSADSWDLSPRDFAGAPDLRRSDLAVELRDLEEPADMTETVDGAISVDMSPAVDLAQPVDMVPMCVALLQPCSGSGLACCSPGTCRTDHRNGMVISRCCGIAGAMCRDDLDCCWTASGQGSCANQKCQ